MTLHTPAPPPRWSDDPRWKGIVRPYNPEDVTRLRGSLQVEYTLARVGAEKLWNKLQEKSYINALGALTGNQAVQQVRAGLEAIYLSGWQVAADANLAGEMYPDQSLYPANSVPSVVARINSALQRADQIETSEGNGLSVDTWFAPIIADAEAGFGGPLNSFELMKAYDPRRCAAGVHYRRPAGSSEKKCGHLGGKVLDPDRGPYSSRRSTPRASPPTSWARADPGHRPHRRGTRRQVADLRH